MAISNGWVGKILRIDLSTGLWDTEDTEKYEPEKFIGGRGLTAKIFWDNVDEATHLRLMDDPWAPESLIAIAVGPVTGTLAPASGRAQLGGVAPQAYPKPTYTRSGIGGHWPSELKYAGFDALYVVGKAEIPVYVLIENGGAEIRDASELWGVDTFETQRALYAEHGSDVRILCIGPAGENLSRISTIVSDSGSAFGQGGFGGVFGSKNLKAIVVRGSGGIKVADPDGLIELAEQAQSFLNREKEGQPSQYFPKPYFGKYYSPKSDEFYEDMARVKKRWDACQACPIGCRYYLDIPGGGKGQAQCVDFATTMLGVISKDAWKGTILGNQLGINFFQFFGLLGTLGAAAGAGHLTEENTGLPFSKGTYSPTFINAMFEAIAYKRGFGAVIAEGNPRLSYYIAEEYDDPSFIGRAQMFGRHGMASHWSEHFPVNALTWATDSRDPYDDFHEYTFWYSMKCIYATQAQKEAAAKKAYGSEKAIDYRSYDWAAQTTKRLIERACIKSSLILCDWAFPIVLDQYTDEHQGDTSLESSIYSAVTGNETSEEEMYVIGDKIFNLERAIMVREGRRREQDHVPLEFTVPKTQSIWYGTYEDGSTKEENMFIDPDYFNTTLLDDWYQLMGWTSDGVPTRAKLEELGMEDVADELGV